MNADQIKQLQINLNNNGFQIPVTGVLDERTTNAMQTFQNRAAAAAPAAAASASAGYTPAQVMDLQKALNAQGAKLKVDGILGPETTKAMNSAVSKSVASNPAVSNLAKNNSPEAIVNAYMTNNWSGVTDLTGKPFTDADQKAAVAEASKALAPAYQAEQAYDTAGVSDKLQGDQDEYKGFLKSEAKDFADNKTALDTNAADQGVLFAGSRFQKQNDLKTLFSDRDAAERAKIGDDVESTSRDYQYKYGNDGAAKLSQYYQLGGGNTYNANVAQGGVRPNTNLSTLYDPNAYKFQGTAVTANKAATQTRAASLLANKANKLTVGGYKNQY